MSDIFISYARQDQMLAKELAQYLQSLGFPVWWDTELLGSDDFNDVIHTELSKARAVVVIWSETSVKSAFVRDEARFALQKGKLVATKGPRLDVQRIPFGFQGQHTEDIANRDKIVRAIEKLGARRAPTKPAATQSEEELASWARVKNSNNPDELIAFLVAYPASGVQELAKTRLHHALLETTGPYPHGSSLSALLSGLVFRLPDFLPIGSSRWAAIGLASGYLLLAAALMALLVKIPGYFSINLVAKYGISAIDLGPALLTLIWLFLCLAVLTLAWVHFHKFVRQRLFAAGLIVVLSIAFLTYIFAYELSLNLDLYDRIYIGYLVSALAIGSLGYALLRMWQAR
jgi:TIR domain